MSKAITMHELAKLPTLDAQISHLMSDLNHGQYQAAMQIKGPVAAIAGAGAGKTKTLISRTAHMLLTGIPATSIMLVTFTNKGAQEIKERLETIVGEDAQYITAGTFHSIMFRLILKAYADHAFLEKLELDMNACTILDESESKQLRGEAIKAMDKDSREMIEERGWESDIEAQMAQARSIGQNVDNYARAKIGYGSPDEMIYRMTVDVWKRYSLLCRAANGIDFDDIMLLSHDLMMADPKVGQELAQRFNYMMLDEYQDTNPVQMKIMDQIAQHHKNIFVVGDEKQSIYAFRGSDISVILGFKKRYPTALIVDMDINYRSTPSILEAANCVAQHMSQKLTDGILKAGKKFEGQGHKVSLVEFNNDFEEAKMIASAIRRDIRQGMPGKDIAVLYRSRAVKAALEQELVRNAIEYRIVGDIGFYQRAEVKNVIALLRMTFRPWDSMATLRILKNTSFGVSDASAKKAMSKGTTASAYLADLATKTRGKNEKTAVAQKVGPLLGAMKAIRQLVAFGEDNSYIRKNVEKLWEAYMLPGVQKAAKADGGNKDAAVENRLLNVSFLLDRFFDEIALGRKPEDILDELTLLGDMSKSTDRDQANMVNLMTIHASKGTEYANVYIPGMDQDTSPGESEDFDNIEEERRTFYVGITRAMLKLTVSYAKEKRKFGTKMRTTASPFVRELSIGSSNPILKYKAPELTTAQP